MAAGEAPKKQGTCAHPGCRLGMRTTPAARTFDGLRVFLLYCALLAVAGPALFWSARLGLRVAPVKVEGFVGYFLDVDRVSVSHVAIPLADGSDLYLSGDEIRGDLDAGTTVEKRRGELAFRFDGAPAAWPLATSHLALAIGGLLALVGLSVLVARARVSDGRRRLLSWLGAPACVLLLLLPGLGSVLLGVAIAFWRGDLDRVTAVATIGAALAGGVGEYRGTWRRLRERLVLAGARRLAAAHHDGIERVAGTVRRVEADFVELVFAVGATPGRSASVQVDLEACERLGLGALPHPPIAVGDRLEVFGVADHVPDPAGEGFSRGVALARRLRASGARPLLVAQLAQGPSDAAPSLGVAEPALPAGG